MAFFKTLAQDAFASVLNIVNNFEINPQVRKKQKQYEDEVLILLNSDNIDYLKIKQLTDGLVSNIPIYSVEHSQTNILEKFYQNINLDQSIDDTQYELFKHINHALPYADTEEFEEKIETAHVLYNLEKGILPIASEEQVESLGYKFILKKNEILHWTTPAAFQKLKKKVNKINYAGPAYSVRICKGVSYRAGSMKIAKEVSEYWAIIDTGTFILTNQRIAYIGDNQSFSFGINKLNSVTLTDEGIRIFKESRQSPYTIKLAEYDVTCAILSQLINNN